MASSFSDTKVGLDEVITLVHGYKRRYVSVLTELSSIISGLNTLPTTYGPLIAAVDILVAANPALSSLKAQKDAVVTEFQELLQTATATKNAIVKV